MNREEVFDRLLLWTKLLGWSDLKTQEHVVKNSSEGARKGKIIRWYECGSHDNVLLQINECPQYSAAVYAIRYRICTGWHIFYPYKNVSKLRKEAERLREWFWVGWFSTVQNRRAFRRRHPECARYSWRRIREEGLPHDGRLAGKETGTD